MRSTLYSYESTTTFRQREMNIHKKWRGNCLNEERYHNHPRNCEFYTENNFYFPHCSLLMIFRSEKYKKEEFSSRRTKQKTRVLALYKTTHKPKNEEECKIVHQQISQDVKEAVSYWNTEDGCLAPIPI